MLPCLNFKNSPPSPTRATTTTTPPTHTHPPLQTNWGQSTAGPSSSTHPSPTVNLAREYTIAVQTNSYNEIWSTMQQRGPEDPEPPESVRGGGQDEDASTSSNPRSLQYEDEEEDEEGEEELLSLSRVLHPSRECVREVLDGARPTTLTRLVSSYFDHSEHTSHLCILLLHRIRRARSIYAPLRSLLENLPLDPNSTSALTQSQCTWAFDTFVQFDQFDNPFPPPDPSDNNPGENDNNSEYDNNRSFHEMRRCFSQLKKQLDGRLRKSRSKVRYLRRANTSSALCFIGITVGIIVTAVAVAAHSLAVLVAATPVPSAVSTLLPSNLTKKELAHIAQLDAAARGTYVLNNDLDTIDRLVARLHTAVEADKLLVRLGLERGRDCYPIHEVAKQLHKNNLNFLHQLKDLEEHICLCFATVNRARSLLLQQIHLRQTHNP